MKKKISLLLIALCGFQIIFNNHKEQALATKAQHLTQELISAQEKEDELDKNPKATKKAKVNQQKKVKNLKEKAIKLIKQTKKRFDELSPSMKVLIATVGMVSTGVAADYFLTGGQYRHFLWDKAKWYFTKEPSNITPSTQDNKKDFTDETSIIKDKYTDYSSLSDKIHSSGKGEAAIQNPLMAAIRLYSDQPGVIAKTEKDYREISSSTYNALLKEYEDARREATWVVNDFEQHRGSPTLTLDELLHIVISGNKYPLIKWSMGLTDLIPNE